MNASPRGPVPRRCRCARPRIPRALRPGRSGASPHGLRFPRRALLRSPVRPPGPSPGPASGWLPQPAASPGSVPPAAARPGSPSGVPPGSPSPRAVPMLALPRDRPAATGPARPGPRSPLPCHDTPAPAGPPGSRAATRREPQPGMAPLRAARPGPDTAGDAGTGTTTGMTRPPADRWHTSQPLQPALPPQLPPPAPRAPCPRQMRMFACVRNPDASRRTTPGDDLRNDRFHAASKRRAHVTSGNPRRGTGFISRAAGTLPLLSGQGRVESYEPRGACLVEFGYGLS